VRNANRVVEEYLQAGEATARLFSAPFTAWSGNGQSQDVAQRMARAASDAMTFWFQLMGQTAGRTAAPADASPAAVASTPAAPREPVMPTAPLVTVEMDSPLPASVTIDVRPGADASRVCVDRLLHRDPRVPPLTGVEVSATEDGHRVTIRLRVEAGQAAGAYSGVLLDERSSMPIGTVVVELSSARRPAGRGRRQ
jgi:hypothetical protein